MSINKAIYCHPKILYLCIKENTMKVLLDIKDNKAASLLEVLRGLSYVKTQPLSEEKALLMKEIKEAVDEMKLIKAGKLKARPVKELLDEL
jgi:hypothetical protein